MDKREFMIAYVLARASAMREALEGGGVAGAAADAWTIIERHTK